MMPSISATGSDVLRHALVTSLASAAKDCIALLFLLRYFVTFFYALSFMGGRRECGEGVG